MRINKSYANYISRGLYSVTECPRNLRTHCPRILSTREWHIQWVNGIYKLKVGNGQEQKQQEVAGIVFWRFFVMLYVFVFFSWRVEHPRLFRWQTRVHLVSSHENKRDFMICQPIAWPPNPSPYLNPILFWVTYRTYARHTAPFVY